LLDHFSDSLWLIAGSVFVAGLIGSPHCMSMCGPIVFNFANRGSRLVAYQFGRMIMYTTAGAIVGAFGKATLGSAGSLWLSTLTLLMISILLLVNGYRVLFGKSLHLPVPTWLGRVSTRLWTMLRLAKLPHTVVAGLTGALTVLLPCGHLYSFLIGAIATGSALRGAVFMFAFWLGSAPLLSFGGQGLQILIRSKLPRAQRLAGALLVIAGLFSVVAFGARAREFKNAQIADPQSAKVQVHCH